MQYIYIWAQWYIYISLSKDYHSFQFLPVDVFLLVLLRSIWIIGFIGLKFARNSWFWNDKRGKHPKLQLSDVETANCQVMPDLQPSATLQVFPALYHHWIHCRKICTKSPKKICSSSTGPGRLCMIFPWINPWPWPPWHHFAGRLQLFGCHALVALDLGFST